MISQLPESARTHGCQRHISDKRNRQCKIPSERLQRQHLKVAAVRCQNKYRSHERSTDYTQQRQAQRMHQPTACKCGKMKRRARPIVQRRHSQQRRDGAERRYRKGSFEYVADEPTRVCSDATECEENGGLRNGDDDADYCAYRVPRANAWQLWLVIEY